MPPVAHEFVMRRMADQAPWVIGRAGMHYRDLIPSRLGGSIIASHIRIPGGGPVPDMVHFHSVGFQLIYCYKGWVDLVYEDQGHRSGSKLEIVSSNHRKFVTACSLPVRIWR